MARPDKAAAVAELAGAFRDSTAAVLTEYRGLTVAELKELRRSLAGNATYAVVKNTLTRIAARDAGIDAFESLLAGPSAIAFVTGDPVEVAKGLRSFGRDHPHLVVKGGILDGKALSAEEIRRLADLESREVLLARFAGGLLAPAQQLVTVLAAPMAQLARLLGALEAKLAADPSAAMGGDGAAATEPRPTATEAAPDPAPASAEPATDVSVGEPDAPAAEEAEGQPDAAAADDTSADDGATDAAAQTDVPAVDDTPAPTDDAPTDDAPTDDAADAPSEH